MIDLYVNDPHVMKHLDAISRRRTPEAQDLTQETLLEMLENNYKHIGQFLHEFRRISQNVWKRQQREQNKREDIDIDTIAAEAEVDVEHTLAALPHSKIARLSYKGYTRREITDALGISSKTLTAYRTEIKITLEAMI